MKNGYLLFYVILIGMLAAGGLFVGFTRDAGVPGVELGFWSGLFHGWIVLVSFLFSLFDGSVAIYAKQATSAWYDFGYVLGVGFTTGMFFSDSSND